MKTKKIVVIGAGSAEFGPQTLSGIMRTEGLHGAEIGLVDIDTEKLRMVSRLADLMNRQWQSDVRIVSSVDRREVLPGADFVILAVAVDRERLWEIDYQTGIRHGITHYAENGGPGAFAHCRRNLAIIAPILADIERDCPGAFLLNFTNPMQRICTAVRRLSRLRCVGICHQISFGYFMLGVALHKELGLRFPEDVRFTWTDAGIDQWFSTAAKVMERVEIKAAGLNHFTWMLGVRDRATGEDLYPLVRERMGSLPSTFEPLTQRMFRIFGILPVPGDCHMSEYVPYTSDLREGTWKRNDIQFYDLPWAARRRDDEWRLIGDVVDGRRAATVFEGGHSERAEFLISAMANNDRLYEEAVNIPNRGYITNLPADAVVEVPAMVDADGINGCVVGDLPEPVAELCRRQIAINELTVEAFRKRDRRLVHQLFAIDPMIQDPDVAVQLAEEYLHQNSAYLPDF